MALVLAIDRSQAPGRVVEQLRADLAGHEVEVVSTVDAALAEIERRIPDLVLFPLTLAADEEASLTETLARLGRADEISTLAVPLTTAGAASVQGGRWFYWFRHAAARAVPVDEPAAVFAADLRRRVDVLTAPAASIAPVTAAAPREIAAVPAPVEVPPPANQEVLPEPDLILGLRASRPIPDLPPSVATLAEEPVPAPSRVAAFKTGLVSRVRTVASTSGTHARKVAGAVRALPMRKVAGAVRALPMREVAGAVRALPLGHVATYWLPRAAAVAVLVVGALVGRTYLKAERPTTGRAELQSIPDGSEVLVDDRSMGVTPLTLELAPGSHAVEFRYKKAVKRLNVEIVAGQAASHSVDFNKKPAGSLRVSSSPPGAAVLVDGRRQGVTPLTVDDVAAGVHTVVFQNESGTIQQTVKVKADEVVEVEASLFSGWLALFSPFDVKLHEGSRPLRLDDRHRVMLTAGRHEIELTNAELGYRDFQTVQIDPGKTTAVSVATPRTALTISGAPPGADVFIDGVSAGTTPLVNYLVDVGTREVLLKHATLGQRRLTVTATVAPVLVNVNF